MAAMSKSIMHEELISKAALRKTAVHSVEQKPSTPTQASPPPPPPTPPPQPQSAPSLTPDLSDGIAHMTAMSKSMMHEELKKKANLKSDSAPKTETEADRKIQERKKIVQDLIKKNEPCSSTRRLNEQRRMEFFSQESSTCIVAENTEESGKNIIKPEGQDGGTQDKDAVKTVDSPVIQQSLHVDKK